MAERVYTAAVIDVPSPALESYMAPDGTVSWGCWVRGTWMVDTVATTERNDGVIAKLWDASPAEHEQLRLHEAAHGKPVD